MVKIVLTKKTPINKFHAKNVRGFNSIEEIKREIFTNDPIEIGFIVYDDFFNYKGGIYKKSSNNLFGREAVRVVGWSTENVTD
jgi:cathepsin B